MRKYNIIYADPPWNGLGWNNGSGDKCPANHYEVQDIEWIKNLPVEYIAADTCFLFLWVTFPNLQEGLDVIKAWGFKYATCAFNWVKRNKKSDGFFVGCGNYTRANSELCLLGVKGRCQAERRSRSVRQVCDARVGRHSEKPQEIRDRIVALCGDVPRVELFARTKTEGWDVWGNEVASDLDLRREEGVMGTYFGKGCPFFTGQWERDSDRENDEPVLTYCAHPFNPNTEHEGNCCESLCPLSILNGGGDFFA